MLYMFKDVKENINIIENKMYQKIGKIELSKMKILCNE